MGLIGWFTVLFIAFWAGIFIWLACCISPMIAVLVVGFIAAVVVMSIHEIVKTKIKRQIAS